MKWAWERGEKLLMLPDQHLGRNTALQDGRAARRDGRLGSERDLGRPRRRSRSSSAKLILWKGHCSVHTRFTVAADRRASGSSIPAARSSCIPKCRSTSCRRPTTAARPSTSSTRCKRQPGGIGLGGRHRDPPRQSARARGRARPDRRLARSVRLPVLDDVPRLAEPPALDSRRARRRQGPQPDRRAGRSEALDAGRARPDAGDPDRRDPSASAGLRSSRTASSRSVEPTIPDVLIRLRRRRRWLMQFHRCPTTTTRSSRTSTSRRWRSITASITRRT